ncbi:MAG: TIGR00730 family Rossman fold protein [Paludibacteraceae bacterium]|nr:TIGR00730 family Rossman fold protein [Paludibacteraceae bacterium]
MHVAVYCSSSNQIAEVYRQAAKDLGRLLGRRGHTLIYGGNGCGLMGDVSSACAQAGGQVVGVNLQKWKDSGLPNADNHQTLYLENLSERKNYMARQAELFIALPGGIGTLDEAADIMARHQIGELKGYVVFFNLNGYYDGLKMQMERFLSENCMTEQSTDAYRFVENLNELSKLL